VRQTVWAMAAMTVGLTVGYPAAVRAQQREPLSVQGDVGFINSTRVSGLVLGGDIVLPLVPSDKHPVSALAGLDFVHLSGIADAVAFGGGVRVTFVMHSKIEPYAQVLAEFVHESMPGVEIPGETGTGESANGFALGAVRKQRYQGSGDLYYAAARWTRPWPSGRDSEQFGRSVMSAHDA
jgi:hypothetical protein